MKITARQFGSLANENNASSLALAVALAVVLVLALLTSTAAHAQTYSVIHNFGIGIDGSTPTSGVTIKGGALYGTTYGGGSPQYLDGVAYQMNRMGSDWIETPILFFVNGGNNPQSRLVVGPDGRLSGVTFDAGPSNGGAVYSLTPPVSICKALVCLWTEDVLHFFQGSPNDGSNGQYGDLVWDQADNLYGTTSSGGASNNGTVYQMTKSGDTWTEAPIHVFSGFDGAHPWGGVVLDANGNLYGTTQDGGSNNSGTIFQPKYVVGVGWTENILHSFQNGNDGGHPIAGLTWDTSGNLYGATTSGAIFKLSPSGDNWIYTVIYRIGGALMQCGPRASLTIDAAGKLYGTSYCSGASGMGSVFELTNTPNGWEYVSLHDFSGADGENPWSNVSIDADGTLYGTTSQGGSRNSGVVWMIKP